MPESGWLILVSHFSLLIPWVFETHICELSCSTFSQGDYAAGTPRRIDVDLMSILHRYVEKKTWINFHVISTFNFDVCNFYGQIIDVVSTYFLWCNFNERKIKVVSTYFLRRNFDDRNIDVASMFFFRPDFDGRKINVFSVCWLV